MSTLPWSVNLHLTELYSHKISTQNKLHIRGTVAVLVSGLLMVQYIGFAARILFWLHGPLVKRLIKIDHPNSKDIWIKNIVPIVPMSMSQRLDCRTLSLPNPNGQLFLMLILAARQIQYNAPLRMHQDSDTVEIHDRT